MSVEGNIFFFSLSFFLYLSFSLSFFPHNFAVIIFLKYQVPVKGISNQRCLTLHPEGKEQAGGKLIDTYSILKKFRNSPI